MNRLPIMLAVLLLLACRAYAEEPVADNEDMATEATEEALAEDATADEEGGPKTMSGMSILGNEEAPKSLVIIPWKSSEIGTDLGFPTRLTIAPGRSIRKFSCGN